MADKKNPEQPKQNLSEEVVQGVRAIYLAWRGGLRPATKGASVQERRGFAKFARSPEESRA